MRRHTMYFFSFFYFFLMREICGGGAYVRWTENEREWKKSIMFLREHDHTHKHTHDECTEGAPNTQNELRASM